MYSYSLDVYISALGCSQGSRGWSVPFANACFDACCPTNELDYPRFDLLFGALAGEACHLFPQTSRSQECVVFPTAEERSFSRFHGQIMRAVAPGLDVRCLPDVFLLEDPTEISTGHAT